MSTRQNYRRLTKRYLAKDNIDIKVAFNYMGNQMVASIKDISNEGTGLIVEREPFSVIDFEIIDLQISTKENNLLIPARILYSQKIGSSGRKRRYGVHFLKHNIDVESFITENCSHATRSPR